MFRFIEVDPGRVVSYETDKGRVVVMRAPGANRGSETEQAIRGRVAVRLEEGADALVEEYERVA